MTNNAKHDETAIVATAAAAAIAVQTIRKLYNDGLVHSTPVKEANK